MEKELLRLIIDRVVEYHIVGQEIRWNILASTMQQLIDENMPFTVIELNRQNIANEC